MVQLLGGLLLAIPAAVHAQFAYATNGGTITITGYTGTNGSIVVPDTINDLAVTGIGAKAFANVYMTSVAMPDSVLNIGDGAFDNCSALSSVILPADLTSISAEAFQNCSSLTKVVLPLGVTDIESNAFNGCSALNRLSIPNSVTNIGEYGFWNSGLTNITFGTGLISIGAFAFSGESDGSSLAGPLGCPLTSITIRDSTTKIGDYAFAYCNRLTNVTLGSGLISLGAGAFADCPITSIVIPASVTNIGGSPFAGCPLTAIDVAATSPAYSSLAGVLFNRNQTELIEYPAGLAGSYAIPDSVTDIADYAFYYCPGVSNVLFNNSVVHIGAYAFSGWNNWGPGYATGCPFTSIIFPASLAAIGDGAFSGCLLLTNAFFLGNAPSADATAFSYRAPGGLVFDPTTAYYLPGTSGWNDFATNSRISTGLWRLPYPLVLQSSAGVQSNGFGFTVSWATNLSVVVETSTDMLSSLWTPIQTKALDNGVVHFTDPEWTNYPGRFYRVRSQ